MDLSKDFISLEEGVEHLLKMCGGNKDEIRRILDREEQESSKEDNEGDEEMYWEDFVHDFLKTKTVNNEKSWVTTKTIIETLKNNNPLLDSVGDNAISKCISSTLKGFGYETSNVRIYKGKRMRGYKLELL